MRGRTGLILVLLSGVVMLSGNVYGQVEVKIKKEHPKIYLTSERVKRLRQEIEKNTLEWQALQEKLDKGKGEMLDYALGYALTGKDEYAKEGVKQLERAIQKGEVNYTVAIAYDWLFQVVPENLRQEWITKVNESCDKSREIGWAIWQNHTEGRLRAFGLQCIGTYKRVLQRGGQEKNQEK